VTEKNSAFFLRKFDKSYVQAFNDKNLTTKIKKKVSSNCRRMFADTVFNQGLYLYYSALNKLVYVFAHSGAFPGVFDEKSRLAFEGRFKMFKHVFFVKLPDFDEFIKEYEEHTAPATIANTLSVAGDYLTQARNIFQSLNVLEGDNDIKLNKKKDAELLETLCVKTSIQVMKFSMNKERVKSFKWVKTNPYYPEMEF
jgi:hypothetical protein